MKGLPITKTISFTTGLVIVFLIIGGGCKRRLSRSEMEVQLKNAMANSLNERVHFDSTVAKFDVLKVTFFEGPTDYDCEFIVRLRKPGGYDTTGAMAAKISKDFKNVGRKY